MPSFYHIDISFTRAAGSVDGRCPGRHAMSVIEVEHLSNACGSAVAVDDITFSVEEGEIFGILA